MAENLKAKYAGPATLPPGSQLWRLATPTPPSFTPEALWEKALEYFQWVEDNPLWEVKSYMYMGETIHDRIPKMRPMTIAGFCLFARMNNTTFTRYRYRDEYKEVCDTIREIVREQKFAGAAADLFNVQIIARDIGLKESTVHEHTGADGGPIMSITATLDPVEASRRYHELLMEPVKKVE